MPRDGWFHCDFGLFEPELQPFHLESVAVVGAKVVSGPHRLPNEAIVFALTFTAECQQLVQALVKGTLMVGLVAKVNREQAVGAFAGTGIAKAELLKGSCAIA